MKIITGTLRYWVEMAPLSLDGFCRVSPEHLTQIADHIDEQSVRIAELEGALNISATSFSNERTIVESLSTKLEQAEKELASLQKLNPKLEYIRSLEKEVSVLRHSAAPVAVPPIKLPTTTLWAKSVPCYSRDDIIAVLTKYGLEVQDGV